MTDVTAMRFFVSGVSMVTAHDHDIEVASLRKQLDEARNAELEQDAARYRWLRCRTTTERITILSRYQYDADMDAAIDAAMAGRGE